MMKINDLEMAQAIIAHEAVRCYLAKETNRKEPATPTSSFGGNFWGKPEEAWPRNADGHPLLPWLQLKCSDLPRAYGAFSNAELVAFYLHAEFSAGEAVSKNDKADFVVRAYQPDERLVGLNRPIDVAKHRYVGINWVETEDYPSLGKYYELFSRDVYDALCNVKDFRYENRSGTKIGGWPTPVQSDQEYPGTWDLQIDMTPNYTYADSGIAYIKKTGKGWYVRFGTC